LSVIGCRCRIARLTTREAQSTDNAAKPLSTSSPEGPQKEQEQVDEIEIERQSAEHGESLLKVARLPSCYVVFGNRATWQPGNPTTSSVRQSR
jgi:hypothetical protein